MQAREHTQRPKDLRISIYPTGKNPAGQFIAPQVYAIVDWVGRHFAPVGVATHLGTHWIVPPKEEAPEGFHFVLVDHIPGASPDSEEFEKVHRRDPEAGIGGKAFVRSVWADFPDPYVDPRGRIRRMEAVIAHALGHLLGLEDSTEPGNLMNPQAVMTYPPPLQWGEDPRNPPPALGLTREQALELRARISAL